MNAAMKSRPTTYLRRAASLVGIGGRLAHIAFCPLVAVLAGLASRQSPAQMCGEMENLGTLGGSYSSANGVSAGGSVVVGQASIAGGQSHPFRWTALGGMQDLGTLGGFSASANGVSADGSVVVGGFEDVARNWHAFRWTASGGVQLLGTLGGSFSSAEGVSADGAVVVGAAQIFHEEGYGSSHAFRWTASGGMKDLSPLLEGYSVASAASADGSVVVGTTEVFEPGGSSSFHAFRWTAAGGMQDLGTLGGTESAAFGVSADGSVVVGGASDAEGDDHPFRWTVSGGMHALGTLGGGYSRAYGVSADGSVVVGQAAVASGSFHAFRWSVLGGVQDLGTLGGPDSWAYGVSPEGCVVVGQASGDAGLKYTAFRTVIDSVVPQRQCIAVAGSKRYAATEQGPPFKDWIVDFANKLLSATPATDPASLLGPAGLANGSWGDTNLDGVVNDLDLTALGEFLLLHRDEVNLCKKGCYLASVTMAGNALLGEEKAFADLHKSLADLNGMTPGDKLVGWSSSSPNVPVFVGVDAIARDIEGFFLHQIHLGQDLGDSVGMRDALDAGHVLLLHVGGGTHWVFSGCYRVVGGVTEFHVVDPGDSTGAKDAYLSYEGLVNLRNFKKARVVSRPSDNFVPKPTGHIQASGSVEFLLTDPSGRRLGVDPGTREELNEIPGSTYGIDWPVVSPEDNYTEADIEQLQNVASRVAYLNDASPGAYQLAIKSLAPTDYAIFFSAGASVSRELTGTLLEGEVVVVNVGVPPDVIQGDVNGDGMVNASDLALLLGAWGASGGSADLNGDGIVGAADLAILLGAWTV